MKKFMVPVFLMGLMFGSFLFLLAEKYSTHDVHILLEREIQSRRLNPAEVKTYTEAVNELVMYANRCLSYATHNDGICRETHAINLIRAMKISDSVYAKTHGFRTSPFQFFERKVAPHMGIQDLTCRLENKKPVCRVIKG